MSIKAEIKQLEKEMEAVEKCIGSSQEELVAINQERKRAVKHLNELRKRCNEAVCLPNLLTLILLYFTFHSRILCIFPVRQ